MIEERAMLERLGGIASGGPYIAGAAMAVVVADSGNRLRRDLPFSHGTCISVDGNTLPSSVMPLQQAQGRLSARKTLLAQNA